MQVGCPSCGHILEFSTEAPRFCSACGVRLENRPRQLPGSDVPTVVGLAALPPTRVTDPRDAPITPKHEQATTLAFPVRSVMPSAFPETVGGYRLVRMLGGGGMGTVFEAVEQSTGRKVALKLIRPEFAGSLDTVERFRREGRLASSIAHPRCVFVLAADEEAGQPYIVMELMPGNNLHDLVTSRGPLPTSEAVRYILDVIEGLQEAHRCGLVHRDVKPSNCFLDSDGRVKIGDFGLSKSLTGTVALTRSGAFLGTLLFAAPEQIRNHEQVDHLADVYSVCATLYFLLTGAAPFEGDDDAAATLARTVTDPLTPMRSRRPGLPSTLDEVVLRGLARARARRWQSLEELRLALLPFVPGNHSLGDVGYRCVAYLIDAIALIPFEVSVDAFLWPMLASFLTPVPHPVLRLLVATVASLLCGLGYFGFMEWWWGFSPGKYLCRLRVRSVSTDDRPGLLRSLLRTSTFYLVKDGMALALAFVLLSVIAGQLFRGISLTPGATLAIAALGVLPFLGNLAGLALLASSMRRGNGFQGLHEQFSGTKTIRLPGLQRIESFPPPPMAVEGETPANLPARVGSFEVLSAPRWEKQERVLIARDPILDRRVWIWMRPESDAPLPARRSEISRSNRPRWLGGGCQDGWRWDAFVASAGCPLTRLIPHRNKLSWARTLNILSQLTDELTAAEAEATLPLRLAVDQVWVEPGGRVLLLDTPLWEPATEVIPPAENPLDLLRQVAAFALTGQIPPGDSPGRMGAPVPRAAGDLLDRLSGVTTPFATLREFRAGLEAVREEPAEVNPPRRGAGLCIQGMLVVPGLLCMFGLGPLLLFAGFVAALFGILITEQNLQHASDRQILEQATLVAAVDPWQRIALTARLAADTDLAEEAQTQLDSLNHDREMLLQSTSWFIRRGVESTERRTRERLEKFTRSPFGSSEEDGEADRLEEALRDLPAGVAAELLSMPGELLAILGFWPLVWVVGSALWRGGLSLPMSGSGLVQADGRPAARWRCAWRTALVWLPILLLLLLALGLDLWRVAASSADADLRLTWAAWLSWGAWWAAAGLVGLYPWLALHRPERGLHDVLAGTYLVPR